MNVADEVQPVIELSGVHKKFGEIVALDGVDLSVARGEVVCVIGPSGCGKSTLLRTINWLEVPDGGQIVLEGNSVGTVVKANGKISPQSAKDLNRARSRMGMVFQQFNLWPHLSVLENVTRAQKVVLQLSLIHI